MNVERQTAPLVESQPVDTIEWVPSSESGHRVSLLTTPAIEHANVVGAEYALEITHESTTVFRRGIPLGYGLVLRNLYMNGGYITENELDICMLPDTNPSDVLDGINALYAQQSGETETRLVEYAHDAVGAGIGGAVLHTPIATPLEIVTNHVHTRLSEALPEQWNSVAIVVSDEHNADSVRTLDSGIVETVRPIGERECIHVQYVPDSLMEKHAEVSSSWMRYRYSRNGTALEIGFPVDEHEREAAQALITSQFYVGEVPDSLIEKLPFIYLNMIHDRTISSLSPEAITEDDLTIAVTDRCTTELGEEDTNNEQLQNYDHLVLPDGNMLMLTPANWSAEGVVYLYRQQDREREAVALTDQEVQILRALFSNNGRVSVREAFEGMGVKTPTLQKPIRDALREKVSRLGGLDLSVLGSKQYEGFEEPHLVCTGESIQQAYIDSMEEHIAQHGIQVIVPNAECMPDPRPLLMYRENGTQLLLRHLMPAEHRLMQQIQRGGGSVHKDAMAKTSWSGAYQIAGGISREIKRLEESTYPGFKGRQGALAFPDWNDSVNLHAEDPFSHAQQGEEEETDLLTRILKEGGAMELDRVLAMLDLGTKSELIHQHLLPMNQHGTVLAVKGGMVGTPGRLDQMLAEQREPKEDLPRHVLIYSFAEGDETVLADKSNLVIIQVEWDGNASDKPFADMTRDEQKESLFETHLPYVRMQCGGKEVNFYLARNRKGLMYQLLEYGYFTDLDAKRIYRQQAVANGEDQVAGEVAADVAFVNNKYKQVSQNQFDLIEPDQVRRMQSGYRRNTMVSALVHE